MFNFFKVIICVFTSFTYSIWFALKKVKKLSILIFLRIIYNIYQLQVEILKIILLFITYSLDLETEY